jgi:hypothetical protein
LENGGHYIIKEAGDRCGASRKSCDPTSFFDARWFTPTTSLFMGYYWPFLYKFLSTYDSGTARKIQCSEKQDTEKMFALAALKSVFFARR